MASTLWFLAIVAACGAMLWAAWRMEPHWASKDGTRFVCYGQALTHHGQPIGRWRELRMAQTDAHTLEVRPRRGTLTVTQPSMPSARNLMSRRVTKATFWKVLGRTQEPHKGKAFYMLTAPEDEPDLPAMIALRLPAKSRAVATLEALAQNKSRPAGTPSTAATPSTPSPGIEQSAAQPDRD